MPEVIRLNEPEWGWFIVTYFFLGGIAAGAYIAASLLEIFGEQADRRAMRIAHWIAFPLLSIGTLLLIVDLGRPERFFHIMLQSERLPLPLPMFKWWSPMSYGSWLLLVLSGWTFMSFADAFWEARTGKALLHKGMLGKLWSVAGVGMGFSFGGYTGMLVGMTNMHVWGDSRWISALFLSSAGSTGLAALVLLLLLSRRFSRGTLHKLEEADRYAMFLEIAVIVAFVVSLGAIAGPFLLSGLGAVLLWGGVLVLGLLVPMALQLRPLLGRWSSLAAPIFALIGGFILRATVVIYPQGLFHP